MSKEVKKRETMAFEERFELALAVRQNGAKDEDGYWTYNEGWSDERIAKEMGVSESLVAKTRTKIGGQLKRGGGVGPLAGLLQRLEALEAKVDELLTAQPRINGAHDKIAELRQHFAKN